VGNIIDYIEARDVLHGEQVGGMRMFFAEDCDQHVGGGHFLFAARLHVENSAL
jgi:hypothetical protein